MANVNPSWPATLPQDPYAEDGAVYKPGLNIIRTQMENGPYKQRRRFTNVPETFTFTMVLSKANLAILMTFVTVTLGDVLPFDWIDFRTGAAAVYRFTKRPEPTWFAGDGDYWTVAFELELLTGAPL